MAEDVSGPSDMRVWQRELEVQVDWEVNGNRMRRETREKVGQNDHIRKRR